LGKGRKMGRVEKKRRSIPIVESVIGVGEKRIPMSSISGDVSGF